MRPGESYGALTISIDIIKTSVYISAMQLEDYFDFQRPDDIRIKGTRVGIESILYEHIHRGRSAEEIAERFRTVTLEQVYATILYYLHNREVVSAYLAEWLEWARAMREEQERNPSPAIVRLREMKAAMEARRAESDEVPVG